MNGSAVIATTVFGLAMVATILIGVWSARGRSKGLTEWSVSSRGLGVLFIWLLMAGETYTSFSFLGAAGWTYSMGVPILYLVAYLTVGFAVAYIVGPALWTYAGRHHLISIADIAEFRFRSRPIGILVAVVATVFLVPYIQVQIQGMGLVVNAMTYGSVDLHVAAVISFVVAEVFILVSGLRGSAWVSVLKDVLVILTVVFLVVYIPLHYLDGVGELMTRMVEERPQWLTFPGHASGGKDSLWFVSTVLLNAVTITIFPTTVAGYLSAKSPNALRRNAILLPWYQLLLFVPMIVGAVALFALPHLGNPDLALYSLVTDSLPSGVVAVIGVAGALSAIVPMSVFMLSIGTLWGRTVLGGGNGSDPRHPRGADRGDSDDVRAKRLSQLVCVIAGLIALLGSLFFASTLVELSVLSYEGLAQLVPVVLVALFWPRMTKAGAVSGMLVGLAVMTVLWASDNDPLYGINGGIIAFAANLLVTVVVTLSEPAAPARPTPAPAVKEPR
ncbi:sodium:solute symporter family protein [Streptomyces tsukubensis]|uniref:Sodium:solute symporter n=1 Tax=Streptomyces tsukubensis TaxID=83656 RepID=A0A1V4A0G5_9ACTN|nr:sodium:solute symporter family protein [Streptomyces tsukubensis]OON71786.1 sodium:solute symporter [Streptomyces tsukubensis]QFR97027.1 sodium:solute symporter family protein [Streptomyces tsukubensis]